MRPLKIFGQNLPGIISATIPQISAKILALHQELDQNPIENPNIEPWI
jgi:hypothetical protein